MTLRRRGSRVLPWHKMSDNTNTPRVHKHVKGCSQWTLPRMYKLTASIFFPPVGWVCMRSVLMCCMKPSPFSLQGLPHTSQGQSRVSHVSFPASWEDGGLKDKGCQGLNHGQTQHRATVSVSSFNRTHNTVHDSKPDYNSDLMWWLQRVSSARPV